MVKGLSGCSGSVWGGATEEAAEGRGPAEKGTAPAAAPGSAPTCAGRSAAHVGADAGEFGESEKPV